MNRRGFFATCLTAILGSRLASKIAPASFPKLEHYAFPKIVTSARQSPGRIDFLSLKQWYRIETKPEDFIDVGKFEFRLIHGREIE